MAGFKISNDVGATVFAILSGLSVLFLTAWMFGTGGHRNTNSPKITPLPVSAESSADQQEVAEARKALSEESARRAELANELRGSKDDLGSLEEESAILQARLKKLKAAVSANSDLEGKLGALNENNGKLKAQLDTSDATKAMLDASIAGLQTKLKASGEGAGKMKVITAELAALKLKFDAEAKASKEAKNSLLTLKQSTAEKEKSLLAQIESLKGSMSGDAKKVSTELEALKLSSADKAKIASAQLAKLKDEVDALTKKLTLDAKACDAAKKTLLAEINQLNGELDALKNGDKLKRAGDFPDLDLPMLVNDPLKLDARVRPLFINLRGISETAVEREATYKKIIAQGNSSAMDVVQFDSGSSEVTAAERTELEAKLKSLGKGVTVLAVGYASTDGDARSNHELSSKRASSVAQEVAKITVLDKDSIQAVYFGQTKRFDEKVLTPNRIVEVWVTK